MNFPKKFWFHFEICKQTIAFLKFYAVFVKKQNLDEYTSGIYITKTNHSQTLL